MQGEDDGIVTVSGDRRSERIHPILMQLKSLQQVSGILALCTQRNYTMIIHVAQQDCFLLVQVPPILQEGKDPAWKDLQQDLRLMNLKEAGTP